MASADYYPYPMHTARDSAPRRRRNLQITSTASKPRCNGSTTFKHLRPAKPTASPKLVQRVDSGFDDASDTSSITFTEEVERRFALQQFVDQYHHGPEEEEAEEEDEIEDDEGDLGKRARDSIDMDIERASTWEDKDFRAKRNRRSRLKMVKKWFKRLIHPGSDGSSWLLTASL